MNRLELFITASRKCGLNWARFADLYVESISIMFLFQLKESDV